MILQVIYLILTALPLIAISEIFTTMYIGNLFQLPLLIAATVICSLEYSERESLFPHP